MNNIIFIGGIHGVGKGTFCKEITNLMDFVHLSSSNLIKWTEISSSQNKKVANINETQQRLILGLKSAVQQDKNYLLDGHFCLLNKENTPVEIPLETFMEINPKGIIIIKEKIEIIAERLRLRDKKSYSKKLLIDFQNKEIERGREIASILKLKLFIYNNNFNQVISYINELI